MFIVIYLLKKLCRALGKVRIHKGFSNYFFTCINFNTMFAFVDDDFIPEESACIPVNDLSLSRGYAVFDYFKVLNGKPIFIYEHLNRLFFSAHEMRLSPAYSKKAIEKIVTTLIEKNGKTEAGIRISITGGSGDGYSISKPRMIITQHELTWPPAGMEKGITLSCFEHQRQLPHVKTTDYLFPIRMQPLLLAESADDFLYHRKSVITESPRANFFIVTKDQRVITPGENILHGVTRNKLLEAAKGKFKIDEETITIETALQAKEAFVTSTTKGVMPVVSIDGNYIGNGKREYTTWFQELLNDLIRQQL
jgi:branched-chain amino acid aminotransferase